MRLGWRDGNILAIKTLELEELEAYFAHREQTRASTASKNQLNMATGNVPVKRTRGPNKPKAAPKPPTFQPQVNAAGEVVGPPVIGEGQEAPVAPSFLNPAG